RDDGGWAGGNVRCHATAELERKPVAVGEHELQVLDRWPLGVLELVEALRRDELVKRAAHPFGRGIQQVTPLAQERSGLRVALVGPDGPRPHAGVGVDGLELWQCRAQRAYVAVG